MVHRSSSLCWSFTIFLALLLALTTGAQDKPKKQESRFAEQTDPVRRARAFPDLGTARLSAFREQLRVENYEEALHILQQYRDEARSVFAGLKQSGIDAEKKSNGFRQFEIHLRRAVRQIGELILTIPYDRREAYEAIRKELDQMDRELINMLFPRQPGYKPNIPGKVRKGP